MEITQLVAVLAIVAALIGLIPQDCYDANCRSVHKQHTERAREAKALALHRASHERYSDPYCRYCKERKEAGGK